MKAHVFDNTLYLTLTEGEQAPWASTWIAMPGAMQVAERMRDAINAAMCDDDDMDAEEDGDCPCCGGSGGGEGFNVCMLCMGSGRASRDVTMPDYEP